jgi:Cu(I)/Ag(I) efflux system periplasmic protein CusF
MRAASNSCSNTLRRHRSTPAHREEAGEALTRDVLAGRAPMLASATEAAARGKAARPMKGILRARRSVHSQSQNGDGFGKTERVMKRPCTLASLTATAFVSIISFAAALHPALAQSSGLVRGQIIDVDQSAGEVTIRHGPIKKLGMDHGMTMVFRAKEPTMLKRIKAGDRVKFDLQILNGDFSVSRIEKVK